MPKVQDDQINRRDGSGMSGFDYSGLSELTKSRLFPKHTFQFSSQQLCYLCKCIGDTRRVSGSLAEIGCEYGHTTVFLNSYINDVSVLEKTYFAIDTFAGFTDSDVSYEVDHREKGTLQYDDFRENRAEWFQRTMDLNSLSRVKVIEADINEYDLKTLGALSFVLLDVDLYRPTRKALPELYEMLTEGGIIVVDDCNPSQRKWDGAYQAYMEFVSSIHATPRIVHHKLGVIKKPVRYDDYWE